MLSAFEETRPNICLPIRCTSSTSRPGKREAWPVDLSSSFARSGKEFAIPPGKSILEVLRAAGLELSYSCEEGVCGACETPLISGIPDHRDSVLNPTERAANKVIMICCSGCKGDRLVLDI